MLAVMLKSFHIFLLSAVFMGGAHLGVAAENSAVKGFSRQNATFSDKRVGQRMWKSEQNTSFSNKSFPIQEWDKHFSSVGSKRSAISVKEDKDKAIFKTNQKTFSTKEFDMADWNQKFADLQKNAQISTDDKARKIADRQLYNMMLQDTQQFADMAEELSLRDLNKYQFRRNRSDDAVPVSKAGSSQ